MPEDDSVVPPPPFNAASQQRKKLHTELFQAWQIAQAMMMVVMDDVKKNAKVSQQP